MVGLYHTNGIVSPLFRNFQETNFADMIKEAGHYVASAVALYSLDRASTQGGSEAYAQLSGCVEAPMLKGTSE